MSGVVEVSVRGSAVHISVGKSAAELHPQQALDLSAALQMAVAKVGMDVAGKKK